MAIQFLRAAGVLFFAASASYCLALLADSMAAGAIITLYWITAMAGRAFLAKFYFPWYTQNLPAYLLLGLGLLCFALWFSRRSLRGESKAAPWVRIAAPRFASARFLHALGRRYKRDMILWQFQNPAMERMSYQTILPGQLTPGFLLPNQNGKPTALSQFPGRILLVALWSPRDADSTLSAFTPRYDLAAVRSAGSDARRDLSQRGYRSRRDICRRGTPRFPDGL